MSAILSRPQCVKCLWHVRFGVNDHRSRSCRSFEVFVMVDPWFPACSLDLLHIWHKYKTCVAHHFQVKTQGLKGHWHFFYKFIYSVSNVWHCAYLTDSLYSTNTTNEHTMCRTLFADQNVIGQIHTGRSFYATSVLWLPVYLTGLLHIWHNYNPWGDDMSHSISTSKVKGTQIFPMFTPLYLFFNTYDQCVLKWRLSGVAQIRGPCV